MTTKSPGQLAYEIDCQRRPHYPANAYHASIRRKTWADLDAFARMTWERDPTPRDYAPATQKRNAA